LIKKYYYETSPLALICMNFSHK